MFSAKTHRFFALVFSLYAIINIIALHTWTLSDSARTLYTVFTFLDVAFAIFNYLASKNDRPKMP